MKQTIAIKVSTKGDKSRSKAMKIAERLSGVRWAALKGDDPTQIEVEGDGVDPAQLTMLLRKEMGFAEIVSVTAWGAEEPTVPALVPALVWPSTTPYYVYEYPATSQYQEPCSIM